MSGFRQIGKVVLHGTLPEAMTVDLGGKRSKTEVDYSEGMGETRCGNCKFFRKFSPRVDGSCTKVWGLIDEHMWCKLFERKGT